MIVKHPEDYYKRFVHLQGYFDDFYKNCSVHKDVNSYVMHSLVSILEVASDDILGELDELIRGCCWSMSDGCSLSSVLNSPVLHNVYISLKDFKIDGVHIADG